MPSYSYRLNDTVTYWSPGENTGFGTLEFLAPVTIRGRWSDKQELFRDVQGKETMSKSVVHLEDTVAVEGYLLLGESTEANPKVAGASEIRAVQRSVSLDGRWEVIKAWL